MAADYLNGGAMYEKKQKFSRIQTNIKTIFEFSGVLVPGDILNLSKSGIFVRTDIQPPVDEALSLRFYLPGDPDPLEVEGRAIWIQNTANAVPGMGVQFDNIPQFDKERIHAFVECHMYMGN
jgi:uncharacterized protein (TIGR02266 family)